MNAKTELLLYQMLWTASRLAHPSFRKLDESFEAWAYRHGFLRQIRRLEEAGYLESRAGSFDGSRVHRLTSAGRLAALGGRDPAVAWATRWDRQWRLFLFDIPQSENSLRKKLTRALTAAGCGCLQGSVWISPTMPAGLQEAFPADGSDCSHLLSLKAQSGGTAADRQMVEAAWDFPALNSRYQHHLTILGEFPRGRGAVTPETLASWAEQENAAWLDAVRNDPLLPSALLPKGYLGRRAWRQRQKCLAMAGHAAIRFSGTSQLEK